ncbi:MAG: VOC family protein [Kofleriaceae bacterium]
MQPQGWPSVVPRIVADDVKGLVAFITAAFGASGDYVADRPTVIALGDARIMISETGERAAMPAFLYVYVDDADAAYARAMAGGATSLEAPLDTPYGDRRAMVEDRWHNVWQLATR